MPALYGCMPGRSSFHIRKNPEDSMSVNENLPDPGLLSRMIKGRRSVRKYKDENLDKDLIQKLIETAAYAPTGHNDNSVLLSVADNKEDFLDIKMQFTAQ